MTGKTAKAVRRVTVVAAACALAFLVGCVTGQQAYQQGDYTKAVHQATRRLKSDPRNVTALDTLGKAYPAAQKWHLKNIELARSSPDPFKWEQIVSAYQELDGMADAIRTTPAALSLFSEPVFFTQALTQARGEAAEARYLAGTALLKSGNRAVARAALEHFTIANVLMPGYKDVASGISIARDLATLRIVVNPVQCSGLSIDIRFFEEQLQTFLNDYKPSEFVRFLSAAEAQRLGLRAPDQIIDISFADFVVESTQIKEATKTHRRDNVVVGMTRTHPPQEVVGTVTADVVTFEKTIINRAQLDLRITEPQTGKVLLRQAIPFQQVWRDSWGTYRGDERAVPPELKETVKRQPHAVPARQELFEGLANHLFGEASKHIREYYRQ